MPSPLDTRHSALVTPLTDPLLVGRGVLLADVCRRVEAGRHVLLVGEAGVGKTRLLQEICTIAAGTPFALTADEARRARRKQATLAGVTAVYVPEAGPQGRFVDTLCQALLDLGALALPDVPLDFREAACGEYDWKEVKKALPTVADREAALITSMEELPDPLSGGRLVLVLDGLDRATVTTARLLTTLQKHATIAGAVRSIPQPGALRSFFQAFGRVEVGPLAEEASAHLVGHMMLACRVHAADPRHMVREVLRRGEGNPAALRAMLYDAAQTKAVSAQDVRDLQARDDAPYFNMGLVYVFALVAASLVRVLMIGMRSTDLYVVLTLFTVLGFLVMRVFRPFFAWQPAPDHR